MRVMALVAMVMSCVLAGYSSGVQQPQPIATLDLSLLPPPGPVTYEWTKRIAFVSNSSIAAGLCKFQNSHSNRYTYSTLKKDCSLTLIRWEDGVLQPFAQTHQFSPSESIHLTSEARVVTTPIGKAPAILYSSDLSTSVELPPLYYASQSGNTVAELTPGGWKLYHLDSTLHPIRVGHGTLKTISDEVAVFQEGEMVRTETLDGKSLLGSFRLRPTWHVQLAGRGRLFLSEYKRARIVDYNGMERLSLRPTEGWGPQVNLSADGNRVLFDHFSRKISILRNTGEILVAVASLGIGVVDEQPNREQVKVIDIATGISCFDLRRGFAENSEASSQNAVISPSGEFVAMVVKGTLSVYRLPATCEAKR